MARNMFDPKALRERFRDLTDEVADIEARTAPLREKYNALSEKADGFLVQAREVSDEFMEIEKDEDLYGKKMELAAVARALGGRTGEPEAAAAAPSPPAEDEPATRKKARG